MPKSKSEKTGRIQTKWPKGTSGNPQGRPRGARNRTTLAVQALLDGEAEKLTRLCIKRALKGDPVALRLCIERLLPPMRVRSIQLTISPPTTIHEIVPAMGQVVRAMSEGNINPQEASILIDMFSRFQNAIEGSDIEGRVVALEERVLDKERVM